jgi:aldehyde dehydrogenase (NAD+)
VDRSCANLKSAASEIAQIKFLQGGKSPFAPSFVLVHEVVKAEFLREFLTAITKYFPENIPLNHKEEYEELSELQRRLANSKAGYGRIVMSGNTNAAETAQLEVAPLVIDGDRRRGAELCKLVGDAPILPIFSIRSLDDAIDYASEMYTP